MWGCVKIVVDDLVPIKNVVINMHDVSGLAELVTSLHDMNPDVHFIVSMSNYDAVRSYLPHSQSKIKSFLDYSDLVLDSESAPRKFDLVNTITLDMNHKFFMGLKADLSDQDHQRELDNSGAVPIDLVVADFPLLQDNSLNIDIANHAMLRAAGKNFLRVAAVSGPSQYDHLLKMIDDNKVSHAVPGLTIAERFVLDKGVFLCSADYDRQVYDFLLHGSYSLFGDVRLSQAIVGGGLSDLSDDLVKHGVGVAFFGSCGRGEHVDDFVKKPGFKGSLVEILNPYIFLAVKSLANNPIHQSTMKTAGLLPVDMLYVDVPSFVDCIGVYSGSMPVEHTRAGIELDGLELLRAAGSNYNRVLVLKTPKLNGFLSAGLVVDADTRRKFAADAFKTSYDYDMCVYDALKNIDPDSLAAQYGVRKKS